MSSRIIYTNSTCNLEFFSSIIESEKQKDTGRIIMNKNRPKTTLELCGRNTDSGGILSIARREHEITELLEKALAESRQKLIEPWRKNNPLSYDWIYILSVNSENGKKIIGAAALQHIEKTDEAEIPFLYVNKEYRNMGYGTYLLSHICSLSNKIGFKRLYIRFNRTDKDFRKYVEKFSFVKQPGYVREKKYYLRVENNNDGPICMFRWYKLI